MTSPGIVATGVRRSFGDVHAVRNVSLAARAGAVTGLVGPNGSGKTTLLLMLASLLAPDAGTLRIGGIDPVSDPAGVRRIMGWMPDALGAWSSLTARETLVMTGRLYDIAPDDAARGAARLLAEVWGPGYEKETHYLRTYFATLRRKLEADARGGQLIKTVRGGGYLFTPEVTRL